MAVPPMTLREVVALAEGDRRPEPVRVPWGWVALVVAFSAAGGAALVAWHFTTPGSHPPTHWATQGSWFWWLTVGPRPGWQTIADYVAVGLVVVFVVEVAAMLVVAVRGAGPRRIDLASRTTPAVSRAVARRELG